MSATRSTPLALYTVDALNSVVDSAVSVLVVEMRKAGMSPTAIDLLLSITMVSDYKVRAEANVITRADNRSIVEAVDDVTQYIANLGGEIEWD